MHMFRRIISCSLAPNTELSDVVVALKTLVLPWYWINGASVLAVEEWFRKTFQVDTVYTFNSGRSALLAILKAFGIGKGDEVIIQAFTCVAVPNSVHWSGAKPVFADINKSYNIDPTDVEKKISNKTKAIIVQHTFGIPANIDKLLSIAKRNNIMLIEDCAHALGSTFKGKPLGMYGDASFFSFGRDKSVSSVWGGAAIIPKTCRIPSAKSQLHKYHNKLGYPSYVWVLKQLLHPVMFWLILPLYNVHLGKLLIYILRRFSLITSPVYLEEKSGSQPTDFPAKYPNGLATLLVEQLKKLKRFSQERKKTANMYAQRLSHKINPETSYLRYPVLIERPVDLQKKAKKNGVLLGNWYSFVIDPSGVSYNAIGYSQGSCPNAELAASRIVNLPTRVNHTQADIIVSLLTS